jgi:AraC-like DNA-binding protein
VGSSALMSIDLGCRGAAVGISLLIASVLLRDRGDSTLGRLGAALLVGAAAGAIGSAPAFPRPWPWWSLLLLALSSGATVVFWLWARAAFDDDFVLRRWHGVLWAAIVGLQIFDVGLIQRWPAFGLAIDQALSFTYLGLALLAAAQVLATWRADLVAKRRRLRAVVLIGTSTYIAMGAFLNLSPPSASGASLVSLANAFGLCALVSLSGWNLFRAVPQESASSLPAPGEARRVARFTAADGGDRPTAIDAALLRRLEHLMSVERAYRREGLTIGSLSAELGAPEYRLRQLINEGLGHRNFNAFLNRYRIEEAKAALADPGQKDVPVLTIAMDTGFQSIGPFNRAFKAATDVTPTEFRRLAAARNASGLPEQTGLSGIGQPA